MLHSKDVTGAKIRELRLQHNVTLRKLAKELSITPSYLSRIESGERHVPGYITIEFLENTITKLEKEQNKPITTGEIKNIIKTNNI